MLELLNCGPVSRGRYTWVMIGVVVAVNAGACDEYTCVDLANCPSIAGDGGATASTLAIRDASAGTASVASGSGSIGSEAGSVGSASSATGTNATAALLPDAGDWSTASMAGGITDGGACDEAVECKSGHCVDGVCCTSACDGLCAACDVEGQEGLCVAPESDMACASTSCPPDTECMSYRGLTDQGGACAGLGECAEEVACGALPRPVDTACQGGAGKCDGSGECVVPDKLGLGEPCTVGGACGSGYCVDSIDGEALCCDGPCAGTCEGCGADGHCSAVPDDDERCDAVSCSLSSECVTYPVPLQTSRCQAFGACWTAESYCQPSHAGSETVCAAGGRDGHCDGAGTCEATIVCGDGITEGDEECDDANQSDTDSCTRDCKTPVCGDGIVHASRGELCDDGNDVNGDGCSRNCVGGFAPKGSTMVTSVHLCGIRASGTPSCWGLNSSGELGRGSTSSSGLELPSAVLNETDVVDIAMNGSTTCAVRKSGKVSCWGSGFGAYAVELGGISDATQISGGDSRLFCARRANGEVGCWGTDGVVSAQAGLVDIVQVALGNNHSCALTSDGAVLCLGANASGEGGRSGSLGGPRATSPILASLLQPAVQLAAGYRHSCYIPTSRDSVQCVGDSQTLGNPSASDGINPVTVLNVDQPEKLAAGAQHVCVMERSGKVMCWGQGAAAASTTVSTTPVEIELPLAAIDVGAGSQTSCALLEDGSTYCWGAWAPTSQTLSPVLINL